MCPRCNKCLASAESLTMHLASHQGDKHFSCPECNKGYHDAVNLRNHMTSHTGEMPYNCLKCDRSHTGSAGLKAHMLSHKGNKFCYCPHCNKGFDSTTERDQHTCTHIFPCFKCDRRFTEKHGLIRHLELVHGSRSNRMRPSKTVFLKRFPLDCTDCDVSFIIPSKQKGHIEKHQRETPNLCEDCVQGFANLSDLKSHMERRRHTTHVSSVYEGF